MMIKYIRTQRIMPLYGVSTNIILSSYHSLYTPLNYKINYYNNININNLSFPSLSTPKFFSTSTATLFEIDYNYDENPELTVEQKFKKYKNKYNQKYITPLKFRYITNLKFNPYFCTYDIETFKNNEGIATPYLFGLYIPEVGFKAFYGLDCVEQAIKFILNHEYSKNKVSFYAHYAGGFDAYLIIKKIIKKINGTKHINCLMDPNNEMFYINFKYGDIEFEFKDSYKLIPLKLNKLIKDLNITVNESKGKLPFKHSWVTKDRLSYNGPLPDWLIKYKEMLIRIGAYDSNSNIFNFQKYSIVYNEVDTIGLHKVIEKFFRILVDNFHINFTHCLTLPQLVMELYRKRNLDDNSKIRLFSKKMQNLISKAYYGANTSVYKPYGEKLYYYDINSLYPFCMLKTMPVGTPKRYDINKGLENFFGFALVKVNCPKELKIPVLPLYLEIEGNQRLVFPTGTFKGYYFSEELKYAKSLGYKIELLEAWEFEKDENLFRDFVEPLYELKRTGNKSERAVFKLCLNTLYGRMGQKREYRSNIITSDLSLMEKIEKTFSNIKVTTLLDNVACYSYDNAPNPNLLKDNPDLFNELLNSFEKSVETRISNIAIAAVITAYARIEIDKFKRLPDIECLYSDTDSLITNKPLPKEFLGDGIGQMKNELDEIDDNYTIERDSEYYLLKGIFLRDKVYSILPRNGIPITKFSGLNETFITKELHNSIKSVYLNNGKNLVLKTLQTSKNVNTFEIKHQDINKTFTFNYNKRIMIKDQNGLWVDTKPIYISSVKTQNLDFEPLIGRQNRQENLSKKVGLNTFEIKINHYNVYNTDYKKFDGFLLCYNAPLYGKELSKSLRPIDNLLITTDDPFEYAANKLLSCLQVLAEKAMEENILVKGIGYLISEEYITHYGVSKINTIGYLNSFNDLQELLNIYEQHLIGIVEGGDGDSGKMIDVDENPDEDSYNIKTLYLRVLIPKKLIKNEKLPVQQLKYIKDTNKLIYYSSQFLALPAPKDKPASAEPQRGDDLIKSSNPINKSAPVSNLNEKGFNKLPKAQDAKLITGALNIFNIENKNKIDLYINRVMELDKKIEKLNLELINYKPDSFNFKMIKTQLMIAEQNRGAELRELYILGLKDPYSYILEKNIKNLIYNDYESSSLPSPDYKYLLAPNNKLLKAPNYKALPAPNYKLLSAPNYKLLTAPIYIIENGGNNKLTDISVLLALSGISIKVALEIIKGVFTLKALIHTQRVLENKLPTTSSDVVCLDDSIKNGASLNSITTEIKKLDFELTKLIKERDSRDYSNKDPDIHLKCSIKFYELKLFFLRNIDQLDENITDSLENRESVRPHDNDWAYFFNCALCDLKFIYRNRDLATYRERYVIITKYLNNLTQLFSYVKIEDFDLMNGVRNYRMEKEFKLNNNEVVKWMESR
jgi:hypothetical protein